MNNKYKEKALTQQEVRKIQLKSLEILLYFKKICDENNLTFYLCGGCCIGSVRHSGFIPWDDDIDVFMPRKDYNKLQKIWNKVADAKKYSCCEAEGRRNLVVNISDNNTTYINELQADMDVNHGLMIDIIPLDGCPSESLKRKMQIFWALVYSLYITQIAPRNHGNLTKIIGGLMLAIIPIKGMRTRIWKFAEKRMTQYDIDDCEYITELCSGTTYMKNKYPKKLFSGVLYKEFEGYLMPVPKGYDEYLKMVFGNYMELPPENQRIPKHDIVFYDLNNSYTKYKGAYYCKEDK